jgi:O-antigen/teichoic acid export membrane protein
MTLRPQERSRFLPNIAALGVSTAVSTLFTFAQVKILALSLTLEMFGLFAALRGLSLLVSMIASNGLPQLLVRFLPVHEARGDARRAMILTVVCAACATGAVAVLVVVVHALRSILLSGVPAAEITPRFEVWFYATTVAVTLKLVLYGGLNGLRRLGAQTWLESTSLLVDFRRARSPRPRDAVLHHGCGLALDRGRRRAVVPDSAPSRHRDGRRRTRVRG